MLRYLTAGESHGKTLVAIVDGLPAGIHIDCSLIDYELKRRQGGYGRGGRQKLETDQVEVLSGIWQNTSLGSPIALQGVNRDYKLERLEDLPRPRPGHGDLAGAVKYLAPIRAILERASARETAIRVAAGALTKQLLSLFDISVFGFVSELGGIPAAVPPDTSLKDLHCLRDESPVYSVNPSADADIVAHIDQCADEGDTLGGVVEVLVEGVPFGLGSHTQWDKKLDGRLAQAVMSIQAFKGVEIGMGFEAARQHGSSVHDPIQFDASLKDRSHLGYIRPSNNAGGIEAGMTNGQPIVIRAAKKPISTLRQPLESVDFATKEPHKASYERSDVCAVPAASVIAENVVAFEIARAFLEKFSADSVEEIRENYDTFLRLARER